jgi:hypothetical protein
MTDRIEKNKKMLENIKRKYNLVEVKRWYLQ